MKELLEGSRCKTGLEDPFDRSTIKRLVQVGVTKRLMDDIGMVAVLEAENPPRINGILVGLKHDEPFLTTYNDGDLRAVTVVVGQGEQSPAFLLYKEFNRRASGGVVYV